MAEHRTEIPEAWVGQEVTVYYGQSHQHGGTLVDVSDKGIVVRSERDGIEGVYWYPHGSGIRLLHGKPHGAHVTSF